MRTVLPIKVFEPFTPDVIDAMDRAFKAAVAVIENVGPVADSDTRETLALRIVESAQRGIRDSSALCDDAVEHWRQTKQQEIHDGARA